MKDIIFQYYPASIKDCRPLGYLSLERFIQSVKKPNPKTIEIFEQIKLADENKDQAEKQRLKSKLYYFTPCVTIDKWRKYENINSFTGLLVLDFDKLTTDYAIEFKQYLFDTYKFIICSWLSASKHGVRAMVKIPICKNINEFKQYFNAIERKLNVYKGFDTAPKNCVLPLFMSYDENILVRNDYKTWTEKFNIVKPPVIKQYIVSDKTERVYNVIKRKIDLICDNGHPQLRAAAFLLGGYVGANYIDRLEAERIIHNLIDGNGYLCQKHDVYKKTATTMIEQGIKEPVYFK